GIASESTAGTIGSKSVEGEEANWKFTLPSEGLSLDEVESSLVRQAIEKSGGNQTKAAELLGISRDQLRYRLKKLSDAESHDGEEVS
ncbi:MAG: helix-turn-helix domain-containing protein, partial [Pyrinomonadaceae bacterium]